MKLSIFILSAALLGAESIVTNGSFEQWVPFTGKITERTPTLTGGLIPQGWSVSQEKPGAAVRADKTDCTALLLEHAAANTSGAEQYIAVSPGSTYRVRCRVKAENIAGNGIVLWLNTGPASDFHAKQKRTATYPPKRGGTYDWQDYEYTLTTDADTAVLRINISLQLASGKAWFSGFEITREGGPVNTETAAVSTKRYSDHVDVKSDVSPKAVGDGSTDDTAALQTALDRISNDSKSVKVVFIPKGIYRITKTLVISKNQGGAVIGEEGTRIVWDGDSGGRMLHANGASRHRYINIIWDGKGKAGVGIDHDSKSYYETRIRHENEQFLDFTIAGIRGGHDPKVTPSAEFFIENCRFERCEKGVSFLLWNYYDNFFTDCEFIDCGNAIYCEKGNFAVRRTRFERSKDADMVITTHSFSVRRSVSVGSGQFIRTFHSGPHGASLMVEGCRVDSWKNRNAVTLAYMGAATVIDTVFSNPPSAEPPIAFTGEGTYSQSLIHSSCTAGMRAIAEPSKTVRVFEVPAGKRGLVPPLSVRFSKPIPAPPPKVFDAKRDHGAAGNGNTDDTDALQRTIDAAKAYGKGAVAYLPFGTYRVTRTLRVNGSDYTLLGSGFATVISFAGDEGTVLSVSDPKNISLEQFRIEVPETSSDRFVKVEHRASGESAAVYDGVYAGGSWRKGKPMIHGLAADGLTATDTIRLKHFDGSVRIRENAGTVFADHIIDGELIVEGAANAGKGFVGVWARICSGNPYDNIVRDNNDIILADYYTEQTEGSLRAEGGASPRLDGRITFHCAKQGWMQVLGALKPGEHKSDGILIDNYGGTVFYTGALMYYQKPTLITQKGTKPVSMIFLGNSFGHVPPEFKSESLTPVLAENYIVLTKDTGDELSIPNTVPDGALAKMTSAFDHFRELGEKEKAFSSR